MAEDHYRVLGISAGATPAEVKQAYRRMVLKYHPDRTTAPGAKEKFFAVQAAYDLLSQEADREAYDRLLQAESEARRRQDAEKAAAARPKISRPAPAGPPKIQNQVRPQGNQDILQLMRYMGQARYAEAERLATRLMREQPKNALPYAVMADIHRFRGEHRQSAALYSFAAQYDPGNDTYQRKHEDALKAMSRKRTSVPGVVATPTDVRAFTVGAAIATIGAAYVVLSQSERPLLPGIELVNTWTLGLLTMLFVAGVALGAGLSLSKLVDPFASSHGSALSRIQPSVLLGFVAVINFWVAAIMYFLMGSTQNAFNESTSRFMGAVAGGTLLFTLASLIGGHIAPAQTLIWGGNAIYIGGLCGWLVSDGFDRHPRF